jgi:Glycosyl transferase family 2
MSASALSASVVIPTHNRCHLIARALRSAIRETALGDEIIVVDDGSTDETAMVVQEISEGLADPRIRYIYQDNAGAGAARNRGVREAKGDLIAFLDSDDEWLPGKMAVQRAFLAVRPDVLFCFTDLIRDYGGKRYPRSIASWHEDTRSWQEITGSRALRFSKVANLPDGIDDFDFYTGDIYAGEMHFNYILTSCLVARRKEAGDALHFMEGVKTYEDWECFGRLAGRGNAAYLDLETAVQHGHAGPRLTDAGTLTCVESRLAVLKTVWGSDKTFLSQHGADYHCLLQKQEQLRVRGLLAAGRVTEARAALKSLRGEIPVAYRIMSLMPGGFLTSLVHLRSQVLGHDAVNSTSTKVADAKVNTKVTA